MPPVPPLAAQLATLAIILTAAFAVVSGGSSDFIEDDTPLTLIPGPEKDVAHELSSPLHPGTIFTTDSGRTCTVGPSLLQTKLSHSLDSAADHHSRYDYFLTSPGCYSGTPKSFNKVSWDSMKLRGGAKSFITSVKLGKESLGLLRVSIYGDYSRIPNLTGGYKWIYGDGADHPSGERYCVLSASLGDSGVSCGTSLESLPVAEGSQGAPVGRVNDRTRSVYLTGVVSGISPNGSAIVKRLNVRPYVIDFSAL